MQNFNRHHHLAGVSTLNKNSAITPWKDYYVIPFLVACIHHQHTFCTKEPPVSSFLCIVRVCDKSLRFTTTMSSFLEQLAPARNAGRCHYSHEPCSAALCDDLVHLANGMVTVMTTYSCDSGFELIGDATCTAGAMDSAATPPSCRRE